ncbi:MAG TPA: hypothetical protein VLW26_06480 [Steroidobacteraceae bacterium]|nr:hypothetical protein [Steroidobacteraceae bacterium]
MQQVPVSVGETDVSAAERRRRVRRTTFVLMLVALCFYGGFIAMSVIRAHR